MKKATMVRVLLCVVIFGVLIASAFVDTTQKPTGNAVAVGSYANGNPAADEAAAAVLRRKSRRTALSQTLWRMRITS